MKFLFVCVFLISGLALKSQCLSGIYTIGGVAPDYPDISTAVYGISTSGICGNVVFKIRPGTYNGYIYIPTWLTSATKTVTFESETGDSTDVVITSDSVYAMRIECKYITINKISLQAIGDGAYGSLGIYSPSQNVKISSCVISHTGGVTYGEGIQISDASNITIQKNLVNAPYMGLAVSAIVTGFPISNIVIDNNIINSDNNGCSIGDVDGLNLIKNTINSGTDPLFLSGCKGSVVVSGNSITGGDDGLVCTYFDAASTLNLYNNFILVKPTSTAPTGFVLQNIPYAEAYFNTVRMSSASMTEPALQISFGGTHILHNNIFMNSLSGRAFYFQSAGTNDLDYNLYYSAGASIGYDDAYGGTVTTLSTYTVASGRETHGLQANPLLVSATDLHIQSTSPARNAADTSSITNDIDGQVREPMPDIGADEYYPPIGIDEYAKNADAFSIFPNPSNGLITISQPRVETISKLIVFDAPGTYVGEFTVLHNQVNLQMLPNGMYFLKAGDRTVKCIVLH